MKNYLFLVCLLMASVVSTVASPSGEVTIPEPISPNNIPIRRSPQRPPFSVSYEQGMLLIVSTIDVAEVNIVVSNPETEVSERCTVNLQVGENQVPFTLVVGEYDILIENDTISYCTNVEVSE